VVTRQVGDETLSPRAYALVRSAYQVITRQGSHRLSLQDVADQAGVSKGMVLYYFKSKEHLFLVTMRWALERTEARIRRRIAGAATRFDRGRTRTVDVMDLPFTAGYDQGRIGITDGKWIGFGIDGSGNERSAHQ